MSGFEVAGIILGGIPLIISALEKYKKVVDTGRVWRHFVRHIRDLVQELETERIILRNTCEKLLGDITTPKNILAMINEPLGSLWHSPDIHDRIVVRLGDSLDCFRRTLDLMQEVTNQFHEKLTKAESSGTFSITRLSFALSRTDSDKLIDALRKHNARLSELADQSIYLEPRRHDRSQCHLMELARSLAKGIFAALRSTIVCACPVSHGINLQLTAFPTSLMAHGDEEMAAKRMMFQLALSFDPDNTGHDNAPWLWELVGLQLIDDKIVPTQAIFNGRPLKSNQKINKRARFATLSNAGQQQPNMDNTGTHHAFNSALALPMASGMQANDASTNISASCVHDLCGAIAKGQDKHNVHCYGYISDKSAVTAPMFGVYPFGQMPSPSCTVISLKDVLEDHGKTFPPLRFRHKVRLSHLFALSVLQLSSSPWMPKILTSRDIIFLRRDDNVLYESVYIASRLPYSSPDRLVFDDARVSPLVPSKELFFLGILLIELALGTTFDKLRSSVSEQRYTKPLDLEADWAMAINALSELQSTMKASPNYFKSVKVCIKCEFLHENIDLNDQIFRQEVYKRVVGPLEEDLLPLSF